MLVFDVAAVVRARHQARRQDAMTAPITCFEKFLPEGIPFSKKR
ncbi:hypothetical protein BURMUCF2_0277 [Burkholderia multivorans CF2]|nr:hypothetical protein BURMUCF2_0277 [Burkholderia multivorans CF2]